MKMLCIMMLLTVSLSFANYDTGASDPDLEIRSETVSIDFDNTSSDPNQSTKESSSLEEDSGYQTGTFSE